MPFTPCQFSWRTNLMLMNDMILLFLYEMVFVGDRRDFDASRHEEEYHLRQQTDLL